MLDRLKYLWKYDRLSLVVFLIVITFAVTFGSVAIYFYTRGMYLESQDVARATTVLTGMGTAAINASKERVMNVSLGVLLVGTFGLRFI